MCYGAVRRLFFCGVIDFFKDLENVAAATLNFHQWLHRKSSRGSHRGVALPPGRLGQSRDCDWSNRSFKLGVVLVFPAQHLQIRAQLLQHPFGMLCHIFCAPLLWIRRDTEWMLQVGSSLLSHEIWPLVRANRWTGSWSNAQAISTGYTCHPFLEATMGTWTDTPAFPQAGHYPTSNYRPTSSSLGFPDSGTLWGDDAAFWRRVHAGSRVESPGSGGDTLGVVLATYQALQPSLFLPGGH